MEKYPEAMKIWEKIEEAENIFINIHINADWDTICSGLALTFTLEKKGKKVTLFSPGKLNSQFNDISGFEKIIVKDIVDLPIGENDLLFLLDSAGQEMVTENKSWQLPDSAIIIDHHDINTLSSSLKVLDSQANATVEILFNLFKDWKVDVDSQTATLLLLGLAADTVFFRYTKDSCRAFQMAAELIQSGADEKFVHQKIFSEKKLTTLKSLAKLLDRLVFEENGKFVWTSVRQKDLVDQNDLEETKEILTANFLQSIKEAEFGLVLIEEKSKVRVSLRSKGKVDVSRLARKFGGGGHHNAAGCSVEGEFEAVIKKILEAARATTP
jgi:bifunctional oligoribonuclease and PAP phosphatase NrnA